MTKRALLSLSLLLFSISSPAFDQFSNGFGSGLTSGSGFDSYTPNPLFDDGPRVIVIQPPRTGYEDVEEVINGGRNEDGLLVAPSGKPYPKGIYEDGYTPAPTPGEVIEEKTPIVIGPNVVIVDTEHPSGLPTIIDLISTGQFDTRGLKTPLSQERVLDLFDQELLENAGCEGFPKYSLSEYMVNLGQSAEQATRDLMGRVWTKSKECHYTKEMAESHGQYIYVISQVKNEDLLGCKKVPNYGFDNYIADMILTKTDTEVKELELFWDIVTTCSQ